MYPRAPELVGISLIAASALALALHFTPSLGFGQAPRAPGIPDCPVDATTDVLSADALQCWIPAPHGLWRILAHASANGALVVETSTGDFRDADHIGSVVAQSVGDRYSEVLVYVRLEDAGNQRTVRLRVTRHGKPERLDF